MPARWPWKTDFHTVLDAIRALPALTCPADGHHPVRADLAADTGPLRLTGNSHPTPFSHPCARRNANRARRTPPSFLWNRSRRPNPRANRQQGRDSVVSGLAGGSVTASRASVSRDPAVRRVRSTANLGGLRPGRDAAASAS